MRSVFIALLLVLAIQQIAAQNNWCQSAKCATPNLMDITTFVTNNTNTGVLTISNDGSYCTSVDKGLSWTYTPGSRPYTSLSSIASSLSTAANQSIIITANNCRAMHTSNGLTLTQIGAPCVNDFVVSAMSPSGINAAATDTYNRIWFSNDAGKTWPIASSLWNGLRYNLYTITMLNFATDNILVAIGGYTGLNDGYTTYRASSAHPLFLWSLDGGATLRSAYIYNFYNVYLNDISCVDLSCLVVGSRTVVYQVAFASLNADPTITQLNSPATGVVRNLELSAVWCVTSQQCWIGGQASFLAMTTDGGQSWSNAVFATTYSAFIYSIRCSDANNCFLIMREGLVYTNSGTCAPNPVPPTPIASFSGVATIQPSVVLVAFAALASLVFAL